MKNKKPEIRFKGFSEEWEEKELGNEVDFFSGLTYSPSNIVKVDGTLVLRSSNVKNGEIVYDDNVYVNSNVVNSENVKVGDIVVVVRNGSRSLIGKHAQIKQHLDNTVIGAFMTGIHCQQPTFINALLDTVQYHKEIEKNLGATINQITTGAFKKMVFQFPRRTEQTQIGNFFKNLDNLITLHQRKYEKLGILKKAMLEKMFPKNGADVPEIRFKGFEGAWEERNASELCSISTGKSNTQDKIDSGEYPFYVRSATIEKSTKYLFDEEAVLTVGDGVGTGKVYHYVNGKYDLHQRVYRMFDFKNVIGRYFYLYFSNNFNNRVMMMTAKTSVDSVRLEMISEMFIKYPSIEEQAKIGNYFKNLDKLLRLHDGELEKLKNLKKALLEKMFV